MPMANFLFGVHVAYQLMNYLIKFDFSFSIELIAINREQLRNKCDLLALQVMRVDFRNTKRT